MNEESWTQSTFLLTVVASVLASLIGFVCLVKFCPNLLMTSQKESVKVRIVDMVGLSMKAAELYPTEAASDAALKRVFERLKQLQEDGYIILTAQHVISAPTTMILSAEDLLRDREL